MKIEVVRLTRESFCFSQKTSQMIWSGYNGYAIRYATDFERNAIRDWLKEKGEGFFVSPRARYYPTSFNVCVHPSLHRGFLLLIAKLRRTYLTFDKPEYLNQLVGKHPYRLFRVNERWFVRIRKGPAAMMIKMGS